MDTAINGYGKRRGAMQLLLDVGLAASLLLALGVVFLVSPRLETGKVEQPGEVLEPGSPSGPVKKLRLGVAPEVAEFDDMGKLLHTLGEGYQYKPLPLDDLLSYSKISEFDVIFLTCSGSPESWLSARIGQGSRAGTQVYSMNEAVFNRAAESLRQFVGNGGTLYASDQHFNLIAITFGDFVDRASVGASGSVQEVEADVVDAELKELLGAKMSLRFDQPDWRPAAFAGPKLTEFLRGSYNTSDGGQRTGSLLVKFPYRDGTVIFTSFHNEKQNSEQETKLLRYLVFSAVMARADAAARETMQQGGFSPAQQGLFSASAAEPSVTKTYQSSAAGPLRFTLVFDNQGGQLRLSVVSPEGKKVEKEGDSTFAIDIPDAAAGQWKYTVTALKIPYANFTYRVTVGQRR